MVDNTQQAGQVPKMLTIREVAMTGVMSEHALRKLVKAGRLPVVYVGKKALINYDLFIEQLKSLSTNLTGDDIADERGRLPYWAR